MVPPLDPLRGIQRERNPILLRERGVPWTLLGPAKEGFLKIYLLSFRSLFWGLHLPLVVGGKREVSRPPNPHPVPSIPTSPPSQLFSSSTDIFRITDNITARGAPGVFVRMHRGWSMATSPPPRTVLWGRCFWRASWRNTTRSSASFSSSSTEFFSAATASGSPSPSPLAPWCGLPLPPTPVSSHQLCVIPQLSFISL